MKKESAQVISEITKQYGLDKYPQDDYTQAVFKEFRKYGKKLLKISNYEDMQKRGIQLKPEIKELMTKKEQFQNHLSSLQRALDLYLSVQGSESKVKKPKAKKGKEDNLEILAQLLAVGKVSQNSDQLSQNPLKKSGIDSGPFVELFKKITILQPAAVGTETTLRNEVETMISMLRKICEKSAEEVELGEKKVLYLQLAQDLSQVVQKGGDEKFTIKSETKVEEPAAAASPLPAIPMTPPPPGLLPEPKKDIGVSTPRALMEEEEMPPDPSKALPVSVLVAGTSGEELKKAKEELSQSGTEEGEIEPESEAAAKPSGYRYRRRPGRYGRRSRGRWGETRGYTYVRRGGY